MSILARSTLNISAAVAILVGCSPSFAPQSSPPSTADSPAARSKSNSWLYVAEDPFSIGIVYVFSYPDPNRYPVRAITRIGYAYGPCADSSGNVWVPAGTRKGPAVLEFAGGGTKPIARLDLPRKVGAGECAVDTITGNLAVLGTHSVNIFAKAKGKPTNYPLGSTYAMGSAYDDRGNLFVDGMKPVSTSFEEFVLYELRKGGKTFSAITLDKRVGWAGGVEWDGQYLAVATGGNGIKPAIYRISVSGSKGTVVQSVHAKGLNYQAWFAVADGDFIGTSGLYGPRLRLWPYPGGGEWIWEMPSPQTRGMAIAKVP